MYTKQIEKINNAMKVAVEKKIDEAIEAVRGTFGDGLRFFMNVMDEIESGISPPEVAGFLYCLESQYTLDAVTTNAINRVYADFSKKNQLITSRVLELRLKQQEDVNRYENIMSGLRKQLEKA